MVYWIIVTGLIPSLGPLGLAGLIKKIAESVDSLKKIKCLAPYTEGQLGYVAMGWAAATLYELSIAQACASDANAVIEGARWVVYFLMAAGGISAAVGAVASKTKAADAELSPVEFWSWTAFIASALTFLAMFRVHYFLEVQKCTA